LSTAEDKTWTPRQEIEIVAGTPPGGGLDRSARALVKAIEAHGLLEVPVRVVNIPGDGAPRAWRYVASRPGDPHVVSISSPNLTTNHLVGFAAFDQFSFTPLAILYTEYIAFVVCSESSIRSGADLVQRLGADPSSITVALSTAKGNPNHIALAQVTRHAGGRVTAPGIRVFDSALDAVADVIAGNADIGAITAASAVPELQAGRLQALAVSSPTRLPGCYARVPTWRELSVDCMIGAWRGVAGPHGLHPHHLAFWENLCRAATSTREWKADLARYHWTEMNVQGRALHDHLERERNEMRVLLGELELIK